MISFYASATHSSWVNQQHAGLGCCQSHHQAHQRAMQCLQGCQQQDGYPSGQEALCAGGQGSRQQHFEQKCILGRIHPLLVYLLQILPPCLDWTLPLALVQISVLLQTLPQSVHMAGTPPLTAYSVSLGETPPLIVWHVSQGCISQVTELQNVSPSQVRTSMY